MEITLFPTTMTHHCFLLCLYPILYFEPMNVHRIQTYIDVCIYTNVNDNVAKSYNIFIWIFCGTVNGQEIFGLPYMHMCKST